MNKQGGTRLNCFSPPVMMATIAIETGLTIYTVWCYKMSVLARLAVAALVCLAIFQLSEYHVCTGYGPHAVRWSRLGFIAITALPPLGLHIVHQLAGRSARYLLDIAYLSMAGFMTFFLTYQAAFIGHQCTGNYVIFQLGPKLGGAYTIYYFAWLLIAMILAGRWSNQLSRTNNVVRSQLQAIRAMIIGYLVFLVPVAVANTIQPSTKQGIPSIMCGFAVIFALILILYIMPRMAEVRASRSWPTRLNLFN